MSIPKRHALTPDEFAFVRTYAAFGRKDAAEAYRRSFLVRDGDDWYEKDRSGNPRLDKPVAPKEANRRAKQLLAQDYISGFLDELSNAASDHARQALSDAVALGEDALVLKAAEKVLADEDKLGFRDAVERWAEIMCALGTEVVVPLPDGREASVPLRELFPKFHAATPPPDVIEKTIRALEQYRDAGRQTDAK